MDNSNCTEHPKKQQDVERRKKLKKEEARIGISSTESVNSGSVPD
jgi:hypothetical protein